MTPNDKKVIKALYDYIAGRDNSRPNLMGVHFEEDRCIATDTYILAIYKVGNPKFAGKTVALDGEIVKGKFPDVDRVFPKKLVNPISVDFRQLRAACSWWAKQNEHHNEDAVVLGGTCLNIRYFSRMLNLFSLTGELGKLTFHLGTDASRPVVAKSEMLAVLLMPRKLEDESKIDDERLPESPVVVSYANLINTYAIESNRPKEKKAAPMSWL